jgi:hypothetical protein
MYNTRLDRKERYMLRLIMSDLDLTDEELAARLNTSMGSIKLMRNKVGRKLINYIDTRKKGIIEINC